MIATVRPLAALLAGVALLLMGSGLLGSLLGVRGQLEGFDARTFGLVMSSYFIGFLIGTYVAPNLIQRIGHIRAFAFYAALTSSAVLLHAILLSPVAWGLLRLVTGIALVGLYTVIESWLNAAAPPNKRSQVFAVYMAVNLGALAVGQQLFGRSDPASFIPFTVVAILICCAALPVTASRMTQPQLPHVPRLALASIYRAAPAAATGALLSGTAMGGFWALGPVYATRLGLDVSAVAHLMSAAIIGGALLQLPIGRLSDRADRRSAMILVSVLAAAIATALVFVGDVQDGGGYHWQLYVLFFAYGGLVFSVYPICVAHLLDLLPKEDMLSGCSSLLLLNGVGSAIGPALAGQAMDRLGPQALPGFFATAFAALAVVAAARMLIRHRDRDHPGHFHPMLRTTPSALELLPETDTNDASPAASRQR